MSSGHGHDAWHHHTTAEGAPQPEHGAHASARALGLTFIVMVLGVIFVILVLVAYFNSYVSSFRAERQEGTTAMRPAFEDKVAAHRRLGEFGWVDQASGTVHIPLDHAIDRVVDQYRAQGAQSRNDEHADVQG